MKFFFFSYLEISYSFTGPNVDDIVLDTISIMANLITDFHETLTLFMILEIFCYL